MSGLFNIGIATIFAREVLEGSIIVVNYRSIIHKNDEWSDERKKESLRTVTVAALIATFVAALLVIAVAIPLGILGHNLDERVVASVEGSSKLIATLFILQFSLKIPVWLGVYEKVPLCGLKSWIKVHVCGKQQQQQHCHEDENLNSLTLAEIRFNVMWNLWREVAECGVFLIPFFLGTGAKAIPVSGVVGIAAALVLAALIYRANNQMNNKCWLASFMAGLTLMLSVGLLIGCVSEYQSLVRGGGGDAGGNGGPYAYVIKNSFWADDKFPLVLIQPFGYSDKRTVLQICFFWLYLAFGLSLHYVMYCRTQHVRAMRQQEEGSKVSKDTDTDEEEGQELSSDEETGDRSPVESENEDNTPAPSTC